MGGGWEADGRRMGIGASSIIVHEIFFSWYLMKELVTVAGKKSADLSRNLHINS